MVVLEYKACSLPYFLDQMQDYELTVILDSLDHSVKQSWEQARFIGYITAQTQSSKKLKPTDVLGFSWDKKEEKKNTTVSNEDRERLRKKAEEIIKQSK